MLTEKPSDRENIFADTVTYLQPLCPRQKTASLSEFEDVTEQTSPSAQRSTDLLQRLLTAEMECFHFETLKIPEYWGFRVITAQNAKCPDITDCFL